MLIVFASATLGPTLQPSAVSMSIQSTIRTRTYPYLPWNRACHAPLHTILTGSFLFMNPNSYSITV